MSSFLGSQGDWYLMRASGFVAFGLLTLTVALGIANVTRWQRGRLTRIVVAHVHKTASLLAVVFLAVHVLTAVSDRYVHIPLLASVIPGLSGYDPLWIGLGAVSFDVLAALVVTSMLRHRIGRRTWRAVHWLAYLCWPTALIHSIGAGSGSGVDSRSAWAIAIYLVCGAAVAAAVAVRLRTRPDDHQPGPRRQAPVAHRRVPALSGRNP